MISAIVAVDKNWGIGYNNQLLEHIPEDMKNFVHLTTGNVVVMGRKTWNSLPKKPLPNRTNIVITSNPVNFTLINGAHRQTLEDTINDMKTIKDVEWFVIGGESIYKQLLPLCERVYLTKIDKEYENVDAYFPNLDEMDEWSAAACSSVRTYNNLNYQFWQYERF